MDEFHRKLYRRVHWAFNKSILFTIILGWILILPGFFIKPLMIFVSGIFLGLVAFQLIFHYLFFPYAERVLKEEEKKLKQKDFENERFVNQQKEKLNKGTYIRLNKNE